LRRPTHIVPPIAIPDLAAAGRDGGSSFGTSLGAWFPRFGDVSMLVAGSPGVNRVFLYNLTDAAATLIGTYAGDSQGEFPQTGAALGFPGDANGDGFGDMVVGNPFSGQDSPGAGSVYSSRAARYCRPRNLVRFQASASVDWESAPRLIEDCMADFEAARLLSVLDAIDLRHAEAVIFHDILRQGIAELACLTGVSEATARSRLVHGRREIRAFITHMK
jgi:FG-GAP repeat protein